MAILHRDKTQTWIGIAVALGVGVVLMEVVAMRVVGVQVDLARVAWGRLVWEQGACVLHCERVCRFDGSVGGTLFCEIDWMRGHMEATSED